MRILVLGSSGMLGMMVFKFLSGFSDFEVIGAERNIKRKQKNKLKFDAEEFLMSPSRFNFLKKFDYIINCIGIIKPFCKDDDPVGVLRAIKVNALFPYNLGGFLLGTRVKVIQIATDCVFSGKKGKYLESDVHDSLDVYGKTKSLGEVFVGNFLNIRCSIIGPELKNKLSLLEWFLSQKEGTTISGFRNHKWNGVTTLQFANLCGLIINKKHFDKLVKKNYVHHFIPNNTVSKFQLLNIFNEIYEKDLVVSETNATVKIDRTLNSNYDMLETLFGKKDMKVAIRELKEFR